jgi:hypothetical protein
MGEGNPTEPSLSNSEEDQDFALPWEGELRTQQQPSVMQKKKRRRSLYPNTPEELMAREIGIQHALQGLDVVSSDPPVGEEFLGAKKKRKIKTRK